MPSSFPRAMSSSRIFAAPSTPNLRSKYSFFVFVSEHVIDGLRMYGWYWTTKSTGRSAARACAIPRSRSLCPM